MFRTVCKYIKSLIEEDTTPFLYVDFKSGRVVMVVNRSGLDIDIVTNSDDSISINLYKTDDGE